MENKGKELYVKNEINLIFQGETEKYKKIYYYELILRENYACASDILRLIILYKYGGIYIDVDTLPYFDDNFKNTNCYLNTINMVNNESICIAKSQAFINIIDNKKYNHKKINGFILKDRNITYLMASKLTRLIKLDLISKKFLNINPLGRIYCPEGLLLLSTLPFLDGIFFSNIICSHPNSRFLKLLLRKIYRLYLYIEKNEYLYNLSNSLNKTQTINYKNNILSSYRNDKIAENDYVTYHLTGPKLIVKTLVKVIFKLFKFSHDFSVVELLRLLQNNDIGIGFTNQNLDTPEGLESVWRKQNEL